MVGQEVNLAKNRLYALSLIYTSLVSSNLNHSSIQTALHLNGSEELVVSNNNGTFYFYSDHFLPMPTHYNMQVSANLASYAFFQANNTNLLAVSINNNNQKFTYITEVQNLSDSLEILSYLYIASAVILALILTLVTNSLRRSRFWPVRVLKRELDYMRPLNYPEIKIEQFNDKEVRSLAESINNLIKEHNQLIEKEKRFSANLSHELRSPLNTLISAAEVLKTRKEEFSPKAQQSIELISLELEKFKRLVEDLLEIARDKNIQPDELESVSAGRLLQESLKHIGVPDDLISLEKDIFTTNLSVDKRRFERILANLIENANTHGNGLTQISARVLPKFVEIRIYDQGIGISQEEKERVFERFYRSTSAFKSTTSGSGLGLTLVQSYIRQFKGNIRIEDNYPSGTVVVVNLPIHKENET